MKRILYFIGLILLATGCSTPKQVVVVEVEKKREYIPVEEIEIKTLPDSIVVPNHLQTKLVMDYDLRAPAMSTVIPRFYAVTSPYQKVRNDPRGEGHFGASRGRRRHNGLDIIVTPNTAVYSPIEGVIFRMAYPYGSTGRNRQWEGILIVGVNEYQGYEVKIFYMQPFVIGEYVFPGDIIGIAQAISRRYTPNMIDHLHVEVRRNGMLLDPAKLFNLIE